MTILSDCDRTIIPPRVPARISFCSAQNKKRTVDKDIYQGCAWEKLSPMSVRIWSYLLRTVYMRVGCGSSQEEGGQPACSSLTSPNETSAFLKVFPRFLSILPLPPSFLPSYTKFSSLASFCSHTDILIISYWQNCQVFILSVLCHDVSMQSMR